MSEHHPEHVPSPSIWPFTVAGGFTLVGFGIITIPALSALGLILMVIGLHGWIEELRHG
jgi:hypothetical protein